MHGHVPDGRRASERRQKFWVPVASVRRLAVCQILANSEEDTLHSSHFPSGEKKQEREWHQDLRMGVINLVQSEERDVRAKWVLLIFL